MLTAILAAITAVGSVVALVLRKKGSPATDEVEALVELLRKLQAVLAASNDPMLREAAKEVSLVLQMRGTKNGETPKNGK